MKSISLSFQVHQPLRLKTYRFADICNDPYYYDDPENERLIREASKNLYLPTNERIIDLLKRYEGGFRIAFSISGTALDLFCLYAPEVIESFQRMADTGGVEFLGETYGYSMVSLKDREEFIRQTQKHAERIEELFGQKPEVFKNTELVYTDSIGCDIQKMGFKAVLTEGARHLLKWRSPNYIYHNPLAPDLNILFKNILINDDLAFRFSNADWTGWAKTENTYLSKLNKLPEYENVVNLYMDYEMICKGQQKVHKSFNFLKAFPAAVFEMTDFSFMTPSELCDFNKPLSEMIVSEPISRQDSEGGDLTAWTGNELQQEATNKLYSLKDKVIRLNDSQLLKDWEYLQTNNHFYYMCSKFFDNKEVSAIENPYNNPYEAFMNYMNVLNDFSYRINRSVLNMKSDYLSKKHHLRIEA